MTEHRWRIVQGFVFLLILGMGVALFIKRHDAYSVAYIAIGTIGTIIAAAMIVHPGTSTAGITQAKNRQRDE